MIHPVHEVVAVSVVVDVPELYSRYEVALSYDPSRQMYTIAVPSLFRAMDTTNPRKVAYKLAEKKLRSGDAEAVEKIVKELLLPQLELLQISPSPNLERGLSVC